MRSDEERFLRAYYLATPLFAGLDVFLRIPIRAVGLESPAARIVYYVGSFLVGLVMFRRPSLAPLLAMGESAVNLTLLMAAVLVPIWSMAESPDGTPVADLPDRVLNLALSGSVLVWSFHRSQARARAEPR